MAIQLSRKVLGENEDVCFSVPPTNVLKISQKSLILLDTSDITAPDVIGFLL